MAPDWPGLERGAATGEAAIERFLTYVPRYAAVTKFAGMEAAFANISSANVVEQYPGTGSTEFWGISFAFSSIDQQPMTGEALDRELTLIGLVPVMLTLADRCVFHQETVTMLVGLNWLAFQGYELVYAYPTSKPNVTAGVFVSASSIQDLDAFIPILEHMAASLKWSSQ